MDVAPKNEINKAGTFKNNVLKIFVFTEEIAFKHFLFTNKQSSGFFL